MKKLLATASVILVSAISLQSKAQTSAVVQVSNRKEIKKQERAIRKNEVDGRTMQQFVADFPGSVNVGTSRNGNISEFAFTRNGTQSRAYYDLDDQLIGTITDKQVSDLPATALKGIKKYYAGYKIGKVVMFDDNEANENDMVLYGRQFEDADNYFIELTKSGKTIVLQIKTDGEIYFFKAL